MLFCSPLLSNVLLLISEKQPLRLNPAEVCDVIAAVRSETSSTNLMTLSSKVSNNSRKPSMDVAVSVLSNSSLTCMFQCIGWLVLFNMFLMFDLCACTCVCYAWIIDGLILYPAVYLWNLVDRHHFFAFFGEWPFVKLISRW